MNMIVCDQKCRHQKEGYCGLNHIARLTADISAKCGYYEPLAVRGEPKQPGDTSHNSSHRTSSFH